MEHVCKVLKRNTEVIQQRCQNVDGTTESRSHGITDRLKTVYPPKTLGGGGGGGGQGGGEGYYLCSKDKGTDQLCLCFRMVKILVFSCYGSFLCLYYYSNYT